MSKYYKAVFMLAVIYLIGMAALFIITGKKTDWAASERNVIKLNEITQDAVDNWDSLKDMSGKSYGVDYVILGVTNDILLSSNPEYNTSMSIETAIKNKYDYTYVILGGQIVGSVVLLDNYDEYNRLRMRLITGLGIFGVILIICACCYGVYIKRRIIVPFQNMKDFAGRIAEGNLDEPLMMDRNNMFGAFTESFDIMREELSESKKREIALQKKERELVASLSHDLKTPITGIKLTTELLMTKLKVREDETCKKPESANGTEKITDIDDAYMVDKLDNIYKKADQIDALVSDLFSSTLDELGEFKVSCTDEEAGVLSDILKKYDDRGLVRAYSIPDVLIRIDQKCMSQVIGNIIANSYKYANTVIDTDFAIMEDYLQMKISDHGPGVEKDELNLITNKFYRGKKWASSSEEGSGLGLYIAKTLMEKMDGELNVENGEEGLTITLLIPLS